MKQEMEDTIVKTRQAIEALQRRNSELIALYKTTLDITRTHDLPDLLKTIVKRAQELLDGTGGGLYLCEHELKKVRCVVSYKTLKDYTGTVLAFGEGAAGTVAATGEPLVIDDYRKWAGRAQTYEKDQPFSAVISVPMLWQGQVTGVISVLREEENEKFTVEDIRLLTSMANQAAIAIENARLYEQTKRLAKFNENIIQNMAEGIVEDDADGFFTFVNPAAINLLGYTADEIIGMHWSTLIPSEQQPIVQVIDERRRQGESDRYGLEMVRKDGKRISVQVSGSPRFDAEGRFTGTLAVFTDITERIRVEKQLRQYANHMEALLEIEKTISSTLDLDEVLNNIMTELQKVIPFDSISLQILQGRSLKIIACRGFDRPGAATGVLFPLDPKFPNYRVIDEKKALAFEDVTREYPHFEEEADKYESGHIRSWLGVPLISKEMVTGMIAMDRSEILPFSATEIKLAAAIAGQAALAIENARLFSESQQRLERLSSLRQIDQAITNNMDLRMTLDILLGHILSQLEVDAAAILLYRPELQNLEFVAGLGFRTQALKYTNLRLGEGHAGKAALNRRIVQVRDLTEQHTGFLRSPDFRSEEFVTYIGIPLIAKGSIIGVLEIYNRRPLSSDAEWMDFLETLAGQAAIAIDNVNLFQDLQKSNEGLIQAYDATIEGWAQALEMRDMETEGHSRRVVGLTTRLAQKMGIRGEILTHIRRGAQLHDIGKMAVPDAILQKPGKLTEEEWEIMRQHPVYAFNWLSSISYLRSALDIPYCHHEKWDGSGYPRGLKGQEIPMAARIFAIVDVWDALRSDRPYRKAWSKEKALSYIEEQSGIHFDPNVVEAFLKMIKEIPDRM